MDQPGIQFEPLIKQTGTESNVDLLCQFRITQSGSECFRQLGFVFHKSRIQSRFIRITGFHGRFPEFFVAAKTLHEFFGIRGSRRPVCKILRIADDFSHGLGKLDFIILVGIVHVITHFVLEDPRQVLIQHRVFRIVDQSPVTNQADPLIHPPPAVGKVGTGHGNIISHIPCQIRRGTGECGLQICQPPGQLGHFIIIAFFLQSPGTEPQQVSNQTAETAQCHGSESHQRRSIFDLSGKTQMMFFDLPFQAVFDAAQTEKHDQSHHPQQAVKT